MSTTVRILGSSKAKLRKLQEAWRRLRGETPSQQELIDRGLDYLDEHAQEFVQATSWKPLTPQELARLRSLQGNYGSWSVEDLDDVVYGDPA